MQIIRKIIGKSVQSGVKFQYCNKRKKVVKYQFWASANLAKVDFSFNIATKEKK